MRDSGSDAVRDGGERLRIVCVTSLETRTLGKNSWSHTLFHMGQALQQYCGDVTFLGPMHAPLERAAGKLVDVACQRFRHQRYMYFHSEWVARRFGRLGARMLDRAGQPFHVVLACGATDVAYLQTDLPLVLVLDATHRLVRDYYPAYSNLTERSRQELDTSERLAIQKAALVLVSSTWAARSVIADYGADPSLVHVAPFGANFAVSPPVTILNARTRADHCRLLFLGTDWQRKGGDLAVATLRELDAMGLDAELVVCGCTPPADVVHPRLRVIPYLNKRDARQREELEALYLNSDYLLLPARSDCAPMVFCEAAAFGLPVVTTDTGGVAEIVRDGETGFTLPYAATAEAYAAVIARTYRDARQHAALVVASRARYDAELNWDAWARGTAPLIAHVARRENPHARTVAPTPQARAG